MAKTSLEILKRTFGTKILSMRFVVLTALASWVLTSSFFQINVCVR